MYERFAAILDSRNLTAYRLSQDTGIPASTFTDWKNGRSAPKIDKLIKIAAYLDIPLDYLVSGKAGEEKEELKD